MIGFVSFVAIISGIVKGYIPGKLHKIFVVSNWRAYALSANTGERNIL